MRKLMDSGFRGNDGKNMINFCHFKAPFEGNALLFFSLTRSEFLSYMPVIVISGGVKHDWIELGRSFAVRNTGTNTFNDELREAS